MIFYFDTSSLIKLVIEEDGSDLADELWNSGLPATSTVLSYPEGRAALGSARRSGRLGADGHREALGAFEGLQTGLTFVDVDHVLARTAGERAEALGLRGYDAVHIATALGIDDGEVVLVTWDRDLAEASSRAGLGIAGLLD